MLWLGEAVRVEVEVEVDEAMDVDGSCDEMLSWRW